MEDIIIIGAGAFAADLEGLIADSNKYENSVKYNIIGYSDDSKENFERYQFKAPWLGNLSNHIKVDKVKYLIGIASVDVRVKVLEYFLGMSCEFISYIHPSALVSESSVVGIGNIILLNTYIGPKVELGNYNIVNSRVIISHDSVVGNNNSFCPGVGISGYTKIGSNNFFGVNSATIPSISIGDGNKIAAGMVVDKKIGDDSFVLYRYKEKVIGKIIGNSDI